jgi:DMSO/TMAO reductase YedYZ molybdopterin-dependent catalytic subunit
VFRSRAEQKAIDAGYDPARLPPGQTLTDKWPVLHAGDVARYASLDTWTFRVFGEVEQEVELSWDELNALPRADNVQDIHCVTRWSRFDMRFGGIHPREVLALARPTPAARFVVAHAEAGFTANVPLSSVTGPDALLATHADGEPLPAEHGYPLRLVVPGKYFWKSAKWLRGLELTADDQPGFWERYGYHNDADPWREERYSF